MKPFLNAMQKSKRSSELSFAAPGLYPPPGTCQTELLVERVEGQDARFGVRALSGCVDTNNRVFLSAEATNTGLVDRDRRSLNHVANVDAVHCGSGTSHEHVARLSAASRVAVVRQHGVK